MKWLALTNLLSVNTNPGSFDKMDGIDEYSKHQTDKMVSVMTQSIILTLRITTDSIIIPWSAHQI